ncbi:MFS transporter [Caulobacter sp. 17J65-9]|uniref:MFS transporter n=1 Tax=Caulobacter sp. 17J65-9 TaxID=2709382 RepID=UPI0013CC6C90|nr:MFS transporter [Caulobacter sp. 17J65-9]NEX93724.1 MFS transporter [Caulobacter sp. 17J65-9]
MATAELQRSATETGGLRRLRSILGGSAGNLVEWYDWYAYSAFALYFAGVFFPKGDQTAQLLNAAAVFAVGFLARPVGAWLMGRYADRRGRKASLTLSVALMCAGSLIIAFCPGYASIGVAAPVILTLARLVQGLSLGGEYGTSSTYLSEMAGRDRRGFWSSFQYMTLISGQLTALGVLLVLQAILPKAELQAWGWRVPFVIGGLLAVSVFWLRRGIDETDSYKAVESKERGRTHWLWLRHPKESLTVIGLTAGGTLSFYTFTIYAQKFLANTAGFSKEQASQISAAALLVMMLIQPVVGAISDKVGRRPVLIAFGVLGTLFTWPILRALGGASDPMAAFFLLVAALGITSGYTAVNAVVKAEMFPTEIRALGVALPYAIANALFGGTAEYVALWFKQAGHETWFYGYVTGMIALSLLVYVGMRDTKKHSRIME